MRLSSLLSRFAVSAGIVAIVAQIATPAGAADMVSGPPLKAMPVLPTKAPPPAPPPAPSWTGCYIDGGAGYGMWDQTHQSINIPTSPAPISAFSTSAGEGWLGRVGGGCDYQFTIGGIGSFVVGAVADYDFGHIHGAFQNTFSGAGGDENESSAWAVGGRIGYLITPALLTYVDGGYTAAGFDQTSLGATNIFPPGAPFAFVPATTYQGWFVGIGTEYALNFGWLPIQGLFWRTEYRYADYAPKNVQEFLLSGAPGTGDRMQNNVQTVTTSLVWRFNWVGR